MARTTTGNQSLPERDQSTGSAAPAGPSATSAARSAPQTGIADSGIDRCIEAVIARHTPPQALAIVARTETRSIEGRQVTVDIY